MRRKGGRYPISRGGLLGEGGSRTPSLDKLLITLISELNWGVSWGPLTLLLYWCLMKIRGFPKSLLLLKISHKCFPNLKKLHDKMGHYPKPMLEHRMEWIWLDIFLEFRYKFQIMTLVQWDLWMQRYFFFFFFRNCWFVNSRQINPGCRGEFSTSTTK